MNKWGKVSVKAGLIAVAMATASTGVANAGMHTNGEGSLVGGNQINAPISVPINLSGNAISALGFAAAYQRGGAAVINDGPAHMKTSGKYSVLGGNQINLPISIPVNVCGNAVGILGIAKAACKSAVVVINRHNATHMKTTGKYSLVGGTQLTLPISVPINACGNAISVLGVAHAWCKGVAIVINGHRHHEESEEHEHEHEYGRPSTVAQAGRQARRDLVPGLSGTSNPLGIVPGLGGNKNPLAQADLPLLSPNNDPFTVGMPLQPPSQPTAPGGNPLSLGNALTPSSANQTTGGLLGPLSQIGK